MVKKKRLTLQEAQEKFDKVIIRYIDGTQTEKTGEVKETVKTVVMLVNGVNVHVGVSKWSNRGFAYNKHAGRSRALGRAEIAFNVFNGDEPMRQKLVNGDPSLLKNGSEHEMLSYSSTVPANSKVFNIVDAVLAMEKLEMVEE